MAKKIALDAGHGLKLAGNKTPDGIDEWLLNNKVALEIVKQLVDYDVTVYRIDDTTGKSNVSLSERVNRVNKLLPDALVSIHHNAYKGKWGNHTGVEVYYNGVRKCAVEKSLASQISAAMSKRTGLTNRGSKMAAFTMLTVNPKVIALLTEGGFMDSEIDHPVITSEKGQIGYAKAISDVLIKQLKLVKKKPATRQSTTAIKIGSPYRLENHTPGFYTAADAKMNRDVRVSVIAGDYTVFNLHNGMINVTKTKGKPGSWINPNKR